MSRRPPRLAASFNRLLAPTYHARIVLADAQIFRRGPAAIVLLFIAHLDLIESARNCRDGRTGPCRRCEAEQPKALRGIEPLNCTNRPRFSNCNGDSLRG